MAYPLGVMVIEEEQVAHEPLSPGPRILVVDDEQTVLESIQGVLELDGYQVVGVSSGQRALELICSQPFDLVLTDLRMDEVDGLEVLRVLRQQAPDAVSIMLTGYGSLDSAVKALREGAYDYLLKPCDIIELRTTVSRGLERCRLARQLRAYIRELEQANGTIRSLNLELEQRVEQATAALREQIQARDEFLATVSHDMKSPLTFIKGLASLRQRRAERKPETEPLLDALGQIEAAASKMARQLDELVDASRLQAGRTLDLRREPTDLVALVQQAVDEHQQTTDRHAIGLQTQVPELVGLWDAQRLERVLSNLLGNAIKYSPRGGSIHVGVETEDDGGGASCAVLRVRDHGEGIPATDLPHIFERFRRGQNVEGRFPGTGIGLAGARQIVELHGGSIAAESQVGEGTTLTVRLPLNQPV